MSSIFVCGNGPSLNYLSPLLSDSSIPVLCMGQAVFSNLLPSIFVFEPKQLRYDSEMAASFESRGNVGITEWIVANSLATLSSLRLSSDNFSSSKVFVNPQHSELGMYVCPNPRGSIYPDYFFVDESSSASILEGLRSFRELHRQGSSKILNFKCSVIRALCFAKASGFKEAVLVGLDPSSSGYWWYDYASPLYDLSCPYVRYAREMHVNLRSLYSSHRRSHPGNYKTFGFPESISIVSRILSDSSFSVSMIGSDIVMRDYALSYGIPYEFRPPA